MEWLSPITGLLAAAVAVPALLLLYFLKLKRREVAVSSTLLWKRAIQDLQVNAPFQRLRRNILLWLQMAILALLLAALARPILSMNLSPPQRYVILIDQSASMRATDVSPSRLEEAKRQARAFVDALRTNRSWGFTDASDQAMVVAFSLRARVLCNFTADRAQLRAALDAVEPTDGDTQLAEALQVAQAFAAPAGPEDKGRTAEAPAAVELFSDGRIADLDRIAAGAEGFRYHAIGESAGNVAIVAMQARRSFEQPDLLNVFAEVANSGAEPVTADVQLAIDGDVRAVQAVTVPAREAGKSDEPGRPGRTTIGFALSHGGGGVCEVHVAYADPLASDDTAWAVLQPPRLLAVAVVTEGNSPLVSAIKACRPARLDVLKPSEFPRPDPAGENLYDLVVLDRYAPAALPRGNYLVFGVPPAASGATAEGEVTNQFVVDWRARHPVLNFINMENLFAAKAARLVLPREATVLAEFEETPALAEVRRQGSLFILASFDVQESNWPFEPGFVMFCYNVAAYVGSVAGDAETATVRPGQPIAVQGPAGARSARVRLPDGQAVEVAAGASGAVRYGGTAQAGVYRVAVDGGAEKAFAVNLLDAAESDIAPAGRLQFAGRAVPAEAAEPRPSNQETWPYLVLAALGLVLIEWYVYNRKVRL
jgi:hypothetical protein